MTELGIINLLSAIYLSGVISLAISLNESRDPRRIALETLRRWWGKFMLLGIVLALAITLLSVVFS